ncbi:hypothetical protein FRC20_010910 [Serendipita sp. 405]|nr:hypothetical protein FRC20_010910 [Serendipita sp. 405]
MALPLGRVCLRRLQHPSRPISLLGSRKSIELLSTRTFHHSLRATAKKKKTKSVIADDPFDEEDGEDDLFGSNNVQIKGGAPTTTPISTDAFDSVSNTRVISTQEQERLREKEKQRLEEFDKELEWLQRTTGENGKKQYQKPGNSSLIRLITSVKTHDDFQHLMTILKQWRIYPATSLSKAIDPLVIETAVKTNNVRLLLSVLSHRPIFGISVPTPSHARLLLRTIICPTNSFPPSYSPSLKNASQAIMDHSMDKQRLEDALRLADVLSMTEVHVPVQRLPTPIVGIAVSGAHGSFCSDNLVPVSLSPSTDIISGSILLSSLFRVIASGLKEEGSEAVAAHTEAAVQLAQKLRSVAKRGAITNGAQSRELLWALSALRECKAALAREELSDILKPKLFTNWIDAAMVLLIKQLSVRGKTVVSRVGDLEGFQPIDGAFERVFGNSYST